MQRYRDDQSRDDQNDSVQASTARGRRKEILREATRRTYRGREGLGRTDGGSGERVTGVGREKGNLGFLF
ncbi:hypothetical protein C1H46_038773 [Malus baccata]|uniref:Uncharacterized protein n=1 Tax=Malus baccata TaxID=106549 RepID=A0A540KN90_MALBA|nr:hypothetical protein C1H46_038773 [Malus baccata]